jgi:hypothetical protein
MILVEEFLPIYRTHKYIHFLTTNHLLSEDMILNF